MRVLVFMRSREKVITIVFFSKSSMRGHEIALLHHEATALTAGRGSRTQLSEYHNAETSRRGRRRSSHKATSAEHDVEMLKLNQRDEVFFKQERFFSSQCLVLVSLLEMDVVLFLFVSGAGGRRATRKRQGILRNFRFNEEMVSRKVDDATAS